MSKPMKKSVSFHTLGCRLNQSETASIQNALEADGYDIVDAKSPADIVVINTCTVTENGDTDTRRLVNRVRRLNPASRIALVGCQAQIQKAALTTLPNVSWVVGNARKMDLVDIFREHPDPDVPQVITPTIGRAPFTQSTASIDRSHTRANLKIQDGCDFFCSFCEIPYARGRARSRVYDDTLREARMLVAAGHREIVLTGINVGTYRSGNRSIVDLVADLEGLDGLDRIRISSIEPTTLPGELKDRMASNESKLCRHLHLPLQSGSDEILGAMARLYCVEEFAECVRGFHDAVPQICIGTDVIVGFPGESDEHFEETARLLRELPIHYFHVFSYSPRRMAKSGRSRASDVPKETIQRRSRVLRELSRRKRRLFYETLVGTRQAVLFEQRRGPCWTGLTDNYVRVEVQRAENLQNGFHPVNLVERRDDCMLGTMAGPDRDRQ